MKNCLCVRDWPWRALASFPCPRCERRFDTIKDPAEFNAYQGATTQADPKAKAAALEGFLVAYPQSLVKRPS